MSRSRQSPEQMAELRRREDVAWKLKEQGYSRAVIAERLGMRPLSVAYVLKRAKARHSEQTSQSA